MGFISYMETLFFVMCVCYCILLLRNPKMISCWFQHHGAVGCYIPPLSNAERKERDQNGDWERRRPVLGLLTSFVAPIQVLGCVYNICIIIIVIVIVFLQAFLSWTSNVHYCALSFTHKLSWIIYVYVKFICLFCSHKCCNQIQWQSSTGVRVSLIAK